MNVAAFLTKAARQRGDAPALRHGERALTYGQFDAGAAAVAGWLGGRYAVGDRVVIYLTNGLEYPLALFGIFRAGLTAVPANRKLHPREIAYMVGHCGARAILVDAKAAAVLAEVLPAGVDIVTVGPTEAGPTEVGGLIPFETLLRAEPRFADHPARPDDLAWIFYTSGTTGRPKGAMLSHRNIVSATMNCLADMCDFGPDDVVFHAAPLSHGSGLYLMAPVARGSLNIIHAAQSFEPDEVLGLVAREAVTVIAFLAPTMIVRLLDATPGIEGRSLRRILYGGAPIHVDHARAAILRFGRIFAQLYGQGEAPMTISYLPPEAHDPDDPDILASAGIVRTDVEVKIAGPDGAPLGPDELGEVCARGDVVMLGYWDDPEGTARTLREGWLHTGDIGRLDPRGRLVLLDRKHDTIISGGTNIYPREIEDVLVQHPGVREAIVFGMPDPEWGENVVAAVVPSGEGAAPSPEELIAFCRDHLASFKKPKAVHILPELPKSAYGKVLRRELRERFADRA